MTRSSPLSSAASKALRTSGALSAPGPRIIASAALPATSRRNSLVLSSPFSPGAFTCGGAGSEARAGARRYVGEREALGADTAARYVPHQSISLRFHVYNGSEAVVLRAREQKGEGAGRGSAGDAYQSAVGRRAWAGRGALLASRGVLRSGKGRHERGPARWMIEAVG